MDDRLTARRLPGLPAGCPLVGALGLLSVLIGSFLPWVQSGAVRRNSYRSAGLLHRLLDVHGLAGVVLDAWPYLGLACALIVICFVAGLRRLAALCGLVLGAVAALLSVTALRTHDSGVVRQVATGPVVTLIGSVAVILAAILFLASHRLISHRTTQATGAIHDAAARTAPARR